MKKIALAFAALITLCGTAHAQSTPPLATVVATCGTPPSTYTAGQNRPIRKTPMACNVLPQPLHHLERRMCKA